MLAVHNTEAFPLAGGLIHIDPVSGVQTEITSFGTSTFPFGVAIDANGDIFIAALDIAGLREKAATVGVYGNREYNPGWHTALDLHSLLTVAEAVARAGAERRESRGAHFREDHPQKDETLGKVNVVIRKADDGTMQVRREPVPEMTDENREIVEENQ